MGKRNSHLIWRNRLANPQMFERPIPSDPKYPDNQRKWNYRNLRRFQNEDRVRAPVVESKWMKCYLS